MLDRDLRDELGMGIVVVWPALFPNPVLGGCGYMGDDFGQPRISPSP